MISRVSETGKVKQLPDDVQFVCHFKSRTFMEKDNPLFFRLRSLRSRKRIIKRDVEKQVRQKYRHSDRLWEMKRNIPLVPLDKPYQKGFVRFFVVRDDVKRSKDGRFFGELLEKINTEMYSPNRKFLKKKRRRGKRIYVAKEQRIANIYPWEWDSAKFGLTEREKQYFIMKDNYCPIRKSCKVYYEYTEPWRFVLKVKPNLITHYKPLQSDLEKEIDETDSFLNRHKVQAIIHKTIYGRPDPWKNRYKRDRRKSLKAFHYIISATAVADRLEDGDLLKI